MPTELTSVRALGRGAVGGDRLAVAAQASSSASRIARTLLDPLGEALVVAELGESALALLRSR